MNTLHPAAGNYFGIPGFAYAWGLLIISLGLFTFIIYRRCRMIASGRPDPRFSDLGRRFADLITYGFIQKRQPRYLLAGVLHLMIFWGFVVLGLRSIDLITQGLNLPILKPIMDTDLGSHYDTLKDLFELIVLAACLLAILRRAVFRPERYENSHRGEAFLVLSLISFLMVTDMFYEGSAHLLYSPPERWLPASQLAASLLPNSNTGLLNTVHKWTYWLHLLSFYFFLNFLPLGKHFHIITSLPNVFLRKLNRGSLKPARWEVENIEDLDYAGIERFEDFTWKHILDFCTCTECGRCTDICPANAIGRPLSPKMITLKLRDHGYERYPILDGNNRADSEGNAQSLVGDVIDHEEIWSCTTCGACEEECPIFIEYIDKIVDMRRHLIESAQNPKTFNQVLMQFEKTGNPFGKPATKRADWIKEIEDIPIKVLDEGDGVDVLFFVDSYGSYDPRVQAIATAIVKGLHLAQIDFGILGPLEMDSGHQVRRIGEEGLFQLLMEQNVEILKSVRFNKIITTDPHAFNTLAKDYSEHFEVQHYANFFISLVESGQWRPSRTLSDIDAYTYHDPCYLGRHNGIYDEPRRLLRAIPGLKIVEMKRAKDRSFCCGGGDIILWHEIDQEEIRMAEMRLQMAKDTGASVIVTACPFCLIHFEDAIKTSGLEEEIRVIDLMELFISAFTD